MRIDRSCVCVRTVIYWSMNLCNLCLVRKSVDMSHNLISPHYIKESVAYLVMMSDIYSAILLFMPDIGPSIYVARGT